MEIVTAAPTASPEINKTNRDRHKKVVKAMTDRVKGILCVEMSAGQMIEDVQLAVEGRVKVEHFGRYGGIVHSPSEIVEALKKQIIGG